MIEVGERFADLCRALNRRELGEIELYVKEGRSHRVELCPAGRGGRRFEVRSEEAGWAVRAGGRSGSLFACGTGLPEPAGPWPDARGEPLQLPATRPAKAAPADGGADAEAPLIVESEAIDRLEAFVRTLGRELPGARVVRAVLDDGLSRARLLSSRGMDCAQRHRAAALYLEVVAGGQRRAAQLAARTAAGFDLEALARRFATLLTVARDGVGAAPEATEMVLAPAAATRLLAGLLPLLVGGDGWRIARQVGGRHGRIASDLVTVADDGSLAGGVFQSDTDGEGVPTREVVLIDAGDYRQPLLSWREAAPARGESSGCMLRPSWRAVPEPGPTHLYIRPDREVAPADLVSSVSRGYYWLDVTGGGSFDPAGDRFELPVCGFRLRRGKASEPVAAARLQGSIGALLRGITGVARDLTFYPHGHLLGAPTLLVEKLELSAAER